jgi:hypothetical protein
MSDEFRGTVQDLMADSATPTDVYVKRANDVSSHGQSYFQGPHYRKYSSFVADKIRKFFDLGQHGRLESLHLTDVAFSFCTAGARAVGSHIPVFCPKLPLYKSYTSTNS